MLNPYYGQSELDNGVHQNGAQKKGNKTQVLRTDDMDMLGSSVGTSMC